MNLIQIQDRLKSLPNDPRVMQMLTAYANGQNPQVPPYLALGELNRRKVLMERAQMEKAGQPPQGTVKDQVEQQAGVMALQQGRQQQAMQRMAQQGGIAGPVPQNIPQPEAQAEPDAMAAGGLASLRPGYRSGGIIAFQKAGSVNEAVDEAEDEDDDAPTGEYSTDAKTMFAQLMQDAAKRRAVPTPNIESRDEARKRMAAEDPDRYGILNKPIGVDALARLEELQSARRAELAKQREELAGAKPGILQLLGQAAMGTRGQKGGSALASILGGYSELASGAEAKQLQQEQALRSRELDLQQAKAEAMNKVEDAQRSQAEGDFEKARKDMQEAQKIANARGISLNNLLGRQITAAGTLAGRESAAKIAADARVRAAKAAGNKPEKPTDLGNMINIEFNALVANGADPADPNTRRIAAQNAARALSKSAGTTRAETDAIDRANTAFENRVVMDRNLRKLRTTDPAAYEARLEEIRKEVETQYKVRPDAAAPATSSPATPSAKPAPGGKPAAAPSSTPPINLLKEGVETSFKNGQTWTLKNGKPVQVK